MEGTLNHKIIALIVIRDLRRLLPKRLEVTSTEVREIGSETQI